MKKIIDEMKMDFYKLIIKILMYIKNKCKYYERKLRNRVLLVSNNDNFVDIKEMHKVMK